MKRLESALALIQERLGPQRRWLAIWSESWRCFEFVGGVRRDGESPRDCVLRKLVDDFKLDVVADCQVPDGPESQFEFETRSEQTRESTLFVMDLFLVSLSEQFRPTLDSRPDVRWLTESEVLAGQSYDRRKIGDSMTQVVRSVQQRETLPVDRVATPVVARSPCEQLAELYSLGGAVPDVFEFLRDHTHISPRELADVVLVDLAKRREHETPLPVMVYLDRLPAINSDPLLKSELIACDYRLLSERRDAPGLDSYIMQFPEVYRQLRDNLASELAGTLEYRKTVIGSGDAVAIVPTAKPPVPVARRLQDEFAKLPWRIGRYDVKRPVGIGAFGIVVEAFDDRLQRAVAIKIPHGGFTDATREAFLTEARNLAALHHPGIVPVYDFGVLNDERCFLVTRLVDGESLEATMRSRRPTLEESVQWIADVADALNYAHCRQIVHRDVKPANILLDGEGRPVLTDFGLALHEREQWLPRTSHAGTPACMSPEQIRSETRHLDGRSDIWSLGVILYELLTGRPPFVGDSMVALWDDILRRDPKPLRVINPNLPAELERICLRCLQKTKIDRYATAADLSRDLRAALAGPLLPTAVRAAMPVLRVIAATWSEPSEPFPIVNCTLMNRSDESLVIVGTRVEVLKVQRWRSAVVSRELGVTSMIDVPLPGTTGIYLVPTHRPVLIGSQDAVIIAARLLAFTPEGVAGHPAEMGAYRFRLHFLTDLGGEAVTDELTLGRV